MTDGLRAFEGVLADLRRRASQANIEKLQAWEDEYERVFKETKDPEKAVQAADELGHIWLCECNFQTKSDCEAGLHADRSGHWVWRFPDPYTSFDRADQECHWSDAGGWYQTPISEGYGGKGPTVAEVYARKDRH